MALERVRRPRSLLQLRIGPSLRTLDTTGALDLELGHDAQGRIVVAWLRRLEGGSIQAFGWTPSGGRQQISSGTADVRSVSLGVSRTGRAALAYSSSQGIFVARRAPGSGFSPHERVAAGGSPDVAVSNRGRVVVAWAEGASVVARAANGAAPFGTPYAVPLRASGAGNVIALETPKVVMTRNGRAVAVVSSGEARGSAGGAVVDRRVEAFEWKASAPRPSGAATLSRQAQAGAADVVAHGDAAVIAWTQRPKGSPRALWTTRWTKGGIQRPNVYDTRDLGLPVLLTSAPHGAVDAFYRAGGPRWFTVRLNAAGIYRGTSTVTPPGEQVVSIDVAAQGAHTAAVWTIGKRSTRVQIARPATSPN